jgi:serine/threonine protein kinase
MRVEEALKQGALENGFARFDEFVKMFQSMQTNVLHQMGRLNALKQEENLGKIDGKIAAIEENQIRHAFLSELDVFKNALSLYLDMSRPDLLLRGTDNQMNIIKEVMDSRLRGHYEVEALIREGNSAMVFKLNDIFTKRKAVAKVLKVPVLSTEIREEVGKVSELKHRNLIKLYGESLDRFPFFIICEFVDGLVLSEVLATTGPRPATQALSWLADLCDVLDYLSQKDIAHSNIRPSKIFIGREYHPMLSPFDIIKAGMNDRTLRKFREDCQYLSPELLKSDGEKLDKRASQASDQFTLGLVAYNMLTGQDLFQGNSIQEIIENRNRFFDLKNKSYRKKLLSALKSPDLIALVSTTLQENPAHRLKDLHTLLSAFKAVKSKVQKAQSIVRASYVRCLKIENELIKVFYDNLLAKIPPELHPHFKNRERQAYMFQMAVDTLLDEHHRAESLSVRASDQTHRQFDLATFELFLDTFIDTLRGLHQTYNYAWEPRLQTAWDDVKNQSLAVIKHTRST